jgi:metal-responsive CopG/Arc/MetJ family transcriptional regulator
LVILRAVKTAVSIPDPLFRAADRLARRLGVSRSELYARALERLVDDETTEDVTRSLDAVYATEDSRLDPDLARAQRRAVDESRWD